MGKVRWLHKNSVLTVIESLSDEMPDRVLIVAFYDDDVSIFTSELTESITHDIGCLERIKHELLNR